MGIGRAKPNPQAAALVLLVRRYPDTLERLEKVAGWLMQWKCEEQMGLKSPTLSNTESGGHPLLLSPRHMAHTTVFAERHFSQKARVEAGTHTNPGQQGGRIGAPHCCPTTPHLPGPGFGCLLAPAAACAASANNASKAKFRTNLRIDIHYLLMVNLFKLRGKRTPGPRLASNCAVPRWRGPGMNLSQLGLSGVQCYAGPQRLKNGSHTQPF